MQEYNEYAPTGFDPQGIVLDEQQNWLVVPVGQNRDSSALDLSNFQAALAMLGGESETVEVHRFGHWACGWIEIIIVEPSSDAHKTAQEIETKISDYPVLDDDDFSEREHGEAMEIIENILPSEYVQHAETIFSSLRDTSPDSITESDVMQALENNEIAVKCSDSVCGQLVPFESIHLYGACVGLCKDCAMETVGKLENALLLTLEDFEISDYVRRTIEDALGRSRSPYHTPDLLPVAG